MTLLLFNDERSEWIARQKNYNKKKTTRLSMAPGWNYSSCRKEKSDYKNIPHFASPEVSLRSAKTVPTVFIHSQWGYWYCSARKFTVPCFATMCLRDNKLAPDFMKPLSLFDLSFSMTLLTSVWFWFIFNQLPEMKIVCHWPDKWFKTPSGETPCWTGRIFKSETGKGRPGI